MTYLLTKENLTPKEVNGHAIDVVAAAVDNVSKVVRPQSLHFLPTGDCKFLYMYATNVEMFSSRKSPYSLEFPQGWGGLRKKSFPWGDMNIFPGLHNTVKVHL